jgi:hypothetical protein
LVYVKCTKKLLARVGAKPPVSEPNHSLILGDWFANIIPVWGGEVIVCLNEASLLTVILPASADAALGPEVRYRVFSLMERLNVPARFAEVVEAEFEPIVIARADNRTMLGRLNQVAMYCEGKVDLKHFKRTQREAEDFLTRSLHGPQPYRRPVDVLEELILAHKNARKGTP